MINNIILVGRTTKNIELKQNKKGTNYVQFILAVNRPYKGEQDQQQADFINCVAWNKTAGTVAKYVSKGNMIGVEGRLQVRSYESETGGRQYISEVLVNRLTFLESKKSSAIPEPIASFNHPQSPTTESIVNPFDPNFSNPQAQSSNQSVSNYENPFATATTLAGGLNATSQTNLNPIWGSEDDLPF